MNYTACMVRECSNLTLDEYSEYGTFCFEHSNLTNSPILAKVPEFTTKLKSITISLGKMNNPFNSVHIYSSSKSERKVLSSEKKIPVVFDGKSNYKVHHEKMKCCVCQDEDWISNKMKCGHLLCIECLDHVRSIKCPLCLSVMQGVLLTKEIIKEIEVKNKEDLYERGEEDKTMSNLALLGYNPEKIF